MEGKLRWASPKRKPKAGRRRIDGRAGGFNLAVRAPAFYVRFMTRMPVLIWLLLSLVLPQLRGQDAAVEERLNKLSGQIEDLMAGQRALSRRIDALAQELDALRDTIARPNPDYAAPEDLKRLAAAIEEVDKKRLEDYEKIRSDLLELGKALAGPVAPDPGPTNAPPASSNNFSGILLESGQWEYVVQTNDALSRIAQTFRREKNLKVTVSEILKANPGLVPDKIRPGQKILIPADSP
jgi:LysM repeat protein/outer membrane murein-binding lipoprotein Lpp